MHPKVMGLPLKDQKSSKLILEASKINFLQLYKIMILPVIIFFYLQLNKIIILTWKYEKIYIHSWNIWLNTQILKVWQSSKSIIESTSLLSPCHVPSYFKMIQQIYFSISSNPFLSHRHQQRALSQIEWSIRDIARN